MNIIQKLGLQYDIFQFKNLVKGDWSIYHDIQFLIENEKKIKEYYDIKIQNIDTIDDYIDCLFLEKYSLYIEMEDYVKDEFKVKFKEVIDFIIECKSWIKPIYYIKFFNKEYSKILNNKNYSFREKTFDLIFKYHSGLKIPIRYCIEYLFYMILDNLEKIQDIIVVDDNLELILKKKLFDEIKTFRLEGYFELVRLLMIKKVSKSKINKAIEYIVEYGREIKSLINDDNSIMYEHTIRSITEFLKEIKSKFADEFVEYCEWLEMIMQSYMEKHGHSFSYEIPIKDLLKPFEDNKISISIKLLYLTHIKDKDGIFKSYHAIVVQNRKQTLVDIACISSIPHDDYFTITVQQSLNLYDHTFLTLLQYYVCRERIVEFMSAVNGLLIHICDKSGINYKKAEFETDINIILNGFIQLFDANDKNNKFALLFNQYGLTMLEIGVIEKFLREFYKTQNTGNYVDVDYCTLGDFLNEQNEIMVKYFGLDNIKILNYYLVRGNKFEVGRNIRNRYAHYKNLKPQDIDWGNTLKATQIFLMILNTLLIYFQ